jgi:hypothetical protein
MSHIVYEDKSLVVFWPTIASGAVVMTVSTTDSSTAPMQTPGCCDHVSDECDRDVVNTVILRVKDPTGYTTKVFSSGASGQWPRYPSGSPTYCETSISVPVQENSEVAVALLICVVDPASGAETRRSQVVVIKHVPA